MGTMVTKCVILQDRWPVIEYGDIIMSNMNEQWI